MKLKFQTLTSLVAIFLCIFFLCTGCLWKKKEANVLKNLDTSGNKFDTKLKGDKLTEQNLSGKWLWRVKNRNTTISEGFFELKEENKRITGSSKMIFLDIKGIDKKSESKTKAAVISMPIMGQRVWGNLIKFKILDKKGATITNTAYIKKAGTVMYGRSKQQVLFSNNQRGVSEYSWKAVKLHNDY